jgi:transcriptional regulator with XRE-family HTH domain
MQSGPEQLRDWMKRRKLNQSETAEHLDMDETYISQIVNGVRTPGLHNALLIERMTGIPVEAWVGREFGEMASAIADLKRKPKTGKA